METRSLRAIATEIQRDWTNPNYAAVPYLHAMRGLETMRDTYGYDTGASIVRYFLANAGSWRGETARRVKAELKSMLKGL